MCMQLADRRIDPLEGTFPNEQEGSEKVFNAAKYPSALTTDAGLVSIAVKCGTSLGALSSVDIWRGTDLRGAQSFSSDECLD